MTLTQTQQDWLDAGRIVVPKIYVMEGMSVIAEIDGQYDILSGTMFFERNASSGAGYQAGYVEAAELKFTLLNTDGKYDDITFEGKDLLVYLDIGAATESELVPYGRYIVDTKPIIGRTIEIQALDYIARLSRPLTADISGKTIASALSDVLVSCSITLYPSSFTNGDQLLGTYDDLDDATSHEVVQWLVALTGGVGYMTVEESPRFRIAELNESTESTVIPRSHVLKESNVRRQNEYSGVGFTVDDTYYMAGDETQSYMEMDANPLLIDGMSIQNILVGIGESIIGVNVVSTLQLNTLGKPFLMPLEKVTYHDEFDNPITTYILTHTWVLNRDSQMTADWSLEQLTGYASMSPLTPAQRVAIRKVAKRASAEISQATSNYEESLIELNERMANALGFYITEVELPSGSKVVYTHDQPTLEASSYISYQSASGFAFTNSGWNSGSPVWEYGLLSEGSLIMRMISTVGLNAEWVKLSNSTKNIKEYVDDEISTHDADLTAHGIKFTEISQTVNGLGEVVGTHTTNISELTATSLEISQTLGEGGENLLPNPTFGTKNMVDKGGWSTGYLMQLLAARFAGETMAEMLVTLQGKTIQDLINYNY